MTSIINDYKVLLSSRYTPATGGAGVKRSSQWGRRPGSIAGRAPCPGREKSEGTGGLTAATVRYEPQTSQCHVSYNGNCTI